MSQIDKKIEWCLRKAEKEGLKHKGLKKVEPNTKKVQDHLAKARRNLLLIEKLVNIHYSDWAVSATFYSMYHCLLAVLWKFGYESRNQECTFALIYSFIEEGIVDFSRAEIEQVSNLDHSESASITTIREDYQYTTKLTLQDDTFQKMLNLAKEILDKTKLMMER